MKKIRVLSLLLPALLLCLFAAGAFSGCAHTHAYTEKVILPTCTSVGYTVHTCDCGDVYYSDYQAKTQHTYSEWTTVRQANAIYGGEETCVCTACGKILFRETSGTSGLTKI